MAKENETSVWKKEISFRRKPKEKPEPKARNFDSVRQSLLPDFEIETGFLVIHDVFGISRRSPAGRR